MAAPSAQGAGFPFSPAAAAIPLAELLCHPPAALPALRVLQHTPNLAKVGITLTAFTGNRGWMLLYKVLNFSQFTKHSNWSLRSG